MGGWCRFGFKKSKINSADYHNEMNTEHYMEWFTQQLLTTPHTITSKRTKTQQQQTKKNALNNG